MLSSKFSHRIYSFCLTISYIISCFLPSKANMATTKKTLRQASDGKDSFLENDSTYHATEP